MQRSEQMVAGLSTVDEISLPQFTQWLLNHARETKWTMVVPSKRIRVIPAYFWKISKLISPSHGHGHGHGYVSTTYPKVAVYKVLCPSPFFSHCHPHPLFLEDSIVHAPLHRLRRVDKSPIISHHKLNYRLLQLGLGNLLAHTSVSSKAKDQIWSLLHLTQVIRIVVKPSLGPENAGVLPI